MIAHDRSLLSGQPPRADLVQDSYVRQVAELARARLEAADQAMRRLMAEPQPHRA